MRNKELNYIIKYVKFIIKLEEQKDQIQGYYPFNYPFSDTKYRVCSVKNTYYIRFSLKDFVRESIRKKNKQMHRYEIVQLFLKTKWRAPNNTCEVNYEVTFEVDSKRDIPEVEVGLIHVKYEHETLILLKKIPSIEKIITKYINSAFLYAIRLTALYRLTKALHKTDYNRSILAVESFQKGLNTNWQDYLRAGFTRKYSFKNMAEHLELVTPTFIEATPTEALMKHSEIQKIEKMLVAFNVKLMVGFRTASRIYKQMLPWMVSHMQFRSHSLYKRSMDILYHVINEEIIGVPKTMDHTIFLALLKVYVFGSFSLADSPIPQFTKEQLQHFNSYMDEIKRLLLLIIMTQTSHLLDYVAAKDFIIEQHLFDELSTDFILNERGDLRGLLFDIQISQTTFSLLLNYMSRVIVALLLKLSKGFVKKINFE